MGPPGSFSPLKESEVSETGPILSQAFEVALHMLVCRMFLVFQLGRSRLAEYPRQVVRGKCEGHPPGAAALVASVFQLRDGAFTPFHLSDLQTTGTFPAGNVHHDLLRAKLVHGLTSRDIANNSNGIVAGGHPGRNVNLGFGRGPSADQRDLAR